MLMFLARNKCLEESEDIDICYGMYLGENDDVSSGFFKGYKLPEDENRSYFVYELTSKDGGIYYGICVYDHSTEIVSFTGWYSVRQINMEDLQELLTPNGILYSDNDAPDDSEE